jgi:hypothetical protein
LPLLFYARWSVFPPKYSISMLNEQPLLNPRILGKVPGNEDYQFYHIISNSIFITLIPTAPKVYWFPKGCAPYVPTFIWLINDMAAYWTYVSLHRLFMNWLDFLHCHFVQRHAGNIFKTYSESSVPGSLNVTSFGSLRPILSRAIII